MDYLQYKYEGVDKYASKWGFKPYYKWITFNTVELENGLQKPLEF